MGQTKYIPVVSGLLIPMATFLNLQSVTVPMAVSLDSIVKRNHIVLACSILSLLSGTLATAAVFTRMLERKIKLSTRIAIIAAYLQAILNILTLLLFHLLQKTTNVNYSEAIVLNILAIFVSAFAASLMAYHHHLNLIHQQLYSWTLYELSLEQRQLILLTIATISYISFVSFVYGLLENWAYDFALYWCICTFTTIGFGDAAPRTMIGKGLLIPVGFGGIALNGSMIWSMRNVMLEFLTIRLASEYSKYFDQPSSSTNTDPFEEEHALTLPVKTERSGPRIRPDTFVAPGAVAGSLDTRRSRSSIHHNPTSINHNHYERQSHFSGSNGHRNSSSLRISHINHNHRSDTVNHNNQSHPPSSIHHKQSFNNHPDSKHPSLINFQHQSVSHRNSQNRFPSEINQKQSPTIELTSNTNFQPNLQTNNESTVYHSPIQSSSHTYSPIPSSSQSITPIITQSHHTQLSPLSNICASPEHDNQFELANSEQAAVLDEAGTSTTEPTQPFITRAYPQDELEPNHSTNLPYEYTSIPSNPITDTQQTIKPPKPNPPSQLKVEINKIKFAKEFKSSPSKRKSKTKRKNSLDSATSNLQLGLDSHSRILQKSFSIHESRHHDPQTWTITRSSNLPSVHIVADALNRRDVARATRDAIRWQAYYSFGVLMSNILVYGWLVAGLEGWSVWEGFYFSFCAFMTIGYGDYTIKSYVGRTIFIWYIFIAIITSTYFFSMLSELAVDQWSITTSTIAKRVDRYETKAKWKKQYCGKGKERADEEEPLLQSSSGDVDGEVVTTPLDVPVVTRRPSIYSVSLTRSLETH
ncbi:hypothetical protein BC833DRAFT_178015 [Globomyces pollinis-pini]|nr:hypothetical protein BC833DRAFT_178015 [Globomyces pollinis-pini]